MYDSERVSDASGAAPDIIGTREVENKTSQTRLDAARAAIEAARSCVPLDLISFSFGVFALDTCGN